MIALPSECLQKHLLQLSVGLISRSMKTLLPPNSAWIALAVMKDFHLGMVERLIEVLRRGERFDGVGSSAHVPSPDPASLALTQRTRKLTVAELRAAETRPPSPPPLEPRKLLGDRNVPWLWCCTSG